ncbi:MAG: hypothetical protein U0574_11225 [Phycisphaerales bacterium]
MIRLRTLPPWAWSLAALALLLAADALLVPGFLRITLVEGRLSGSLVDLVREAAPLALVAVGMSVVLATRGVDLSVGAVMAMSAASAAWGLSNGLAWPLVALVALLPGAFAGGLNGVLVAGLRIPPMVATLAVLVAGRGVAQIVGQGQVQPIEAPWLLWLGAGHAAGVPVPALLAVAAAALLLCLMRGTALGVMVAAVGRAPAAAALAGVPALGVVWAAYLLSGVLAAAAGVIQAADVAAADANNAGLGMELGAIVAAVLGGTSLRGGRARCGGALVGALLVQAVDTTLLAQGVPSSILLAAKALLLLVVCLPQALHERRDWTAAAAAPTPAELRRMRRAPAIAAALVVAAGFALAAWWLPGFGAWTFVAGSLLGDSAVLGVAALGMTLVVLAGGIDLSVGAVAALASMLFAAAVVRGGWSPGAAAGAALCAGAAVGLLHGVLVAWVRLPAFLVTLVGMYLARGAAQALDPDARLSLEGACDGLAEWRLLGVPFQVLAWLGLSLLAWVLLERTVAGRRLLAVGGDPQAARLMGVPVGTASASAYVASGVLAALAGVLGAVAAGAGDSQQSSLLELDAVAAVVIGGTLLSGGVGGPLRTVAGVLALALVGGVFPFLGDVSPWWARIAGGGLLLAFVLLQRGLIRLPTPGRRRSAPAGGPPPVARHP